MILFTRDKIKSSFTKVCSIAVAFMIGYWVYKYKVEDRDIGVVDYISLRTAGHIDMPVASLCFKDPFINEKLRDFNDDIWSNAINRDTYLEYLNGDNFDVQFETVDYKNATIDLGNYFIYVKEQWQNSTLWKNSSQRVEHNEIFNGFYFGSFLKCFLLKIDIGSNRHIKGLKFHYNLKSLMDDWGDRSTKMKFYFKIHYPGQFFLGDDPIRDYLDEESSSLSAWIKDLEILERRNSEKRKCSEESTFFDKMISEEYLSSVDCKVPYLSLGKSIPPCNSTDQIKNSKFDYFTAELLQIPEACKRISKMRVTAQSGKKNYRQRDEWYFYMFYPKKVKVITQSKEVDFHALIGNIGGYLGLFLGK